MNENHTLIAFLACLVAIVILVLAGAWLAVNGKSAEALGIGGAVTGLIGVIGTFRPRSPTGNVEKADTVNQVTP